ncbi:unnamed protein product [Boreogadus saida]
MSVHCQRSSSGKEEEGEDREAVDRSELGEEDDEEEENESQEKILIGLKVSKGREEKGQRDPNEECIAVVQPGGDKGMDELLCISQGLCCLRGFILPRGLSLCQRNLTQPVKDQQQAP